MAKILVTGAAGFIGFHTARRLLADGHQVVGLDVVNDYYDVRLKEGRLALLAEIPGFSFLRQNLADREAVAKAFAEGGFEVVINLAAQAGVRYSVQNPYAYLDSNLAGFLNVLEGCRHHGVGHLIYASSSSVYGANATMPFRVSDGADHPLSLYAATKRANELMAHTYANLYGLPCTGLRFFTVYGPWGRPDMALFKFADAILDGRPIDVYNHGDMQRDFTYVDDIVEGLVRLAFIPATPDPEWDADQPDTGTSFAPYRLYNIGNHSPVQLLYLIEIIEKELGREAVKNMMPMQPGDVKATCAYVDDLSAICGFRPETPIEVGVARFVAWYRDFYGR